MSPCENIQMSFRLNELHYLLKLSWDFSLNICIIARIHRTKSSALASIQLRALIAGKHKHRIPNMSAFACSAAPQTASAPSTSSNPSLNRIYSSERIISNKTYLRRLHINFRDAKILFFGASEWRSSSSMSKSQEVGAARYLPDETVAHTEVYLIDDLGRLWPVQYECVLRGGQRHSRLKFGWSKLCRANCFSVADRIQFHRFAHLDRRITINVCKVNFQSH